MGFIQFFSDKTVITLKCTVFLAYHVHVIILFVLAKRRQKLFHNEHTLVGFLLVRYTEEHTEEEKGVENKEMSMYGFTSSMAVPLESSVWVTVDSFGRGWRRSLLHNAINVVVGPL